MTQKQIYISNLVSRMRSAGTNNWSSYDMSDLCEIAGIWDNWVLTTNYQEECDMALEAAAILKVEIRHYIQKLVNGTASNY